MRLLLRLTFALVVLFGFSLDLLAQCYGNPQYESQICAYSPISYAPSSTCSNCTHTWSTSYLVSGQNTALATYIFPGNGPGHNNAYPSCNSYNPNANCSYGDTWMTTVGLKPNFPLVTLINGPWNGDTSKVWVYARQRGSIYVAPQYVYTPTWTVSSGTIASTTITPYSCCGFNDTLRVKWNGNGPMGLVEARSTTHFGTWGFPFNCTWNTQGDTLTNPPLTIFHGSICAGTNANFFTFPYPNSTYTWSSTNGTVASGQGSNSAQINMAGAGTVTVVRDSAGTLTSTNISVAPLIPIVNLGPNQVICQGTTTTLTANPGFGSYLWSNGATSQSITVGTAGNYAVTASTNGGCIAMDTIAIAIQSTTPPNLGPDINTCIFPQTLNAGSSYVAYNWSNGATTQSNAVNAGGSYRVTVTDGNGCQSTDTVVVYDRRVGINMAPTLAYCAPGPYTVNPSYNNASAYIWSTGATTPTIQVTGLGTQTFAVTASNIYGCSNADTVAVTGNPRPQPSLGPDQTICPGTSAILDPGPGFNSYFWSTGAITQQISVTNPGSYRVTVTNANNCSASDTIVVSNYAFVPVNLGPNINVCQPSANVDAGPGYTSYAWNTGATSQTISVTAAGQYAVTVVGLNGCTSSDTIDVLFSNLALNLGGNVTVCEPTIVALNPNISGNITYAWSNGAATPTLSLSAPGTYAVTCTISNAFGCTATDNATVTILPTPASPLGADTIMCADTSIVLNMGSAFVSYQWSTGATTPAITATSGGSYRVTATAANGCQRLDTLGISGLVDCVFPGDVNYDGVANLSDVIALGTAIGFGGTARNNASLQWYGQRALNWSGTVTTGVNLKQADTDGNGLISPGDTMGIHNNFGNTHSRIGTVTSGNARLVLAPLNSPVIAGDTLRYGVFLESTTGGTVDSIFGITLQLTWPNQLLSGDGLISIDHSNAWFATQGNQLSFLKRGLTYADIALTRMAGLDTTGSGLVMILSFATDPNLTVGSVNSFLPSLNIGQVSGRDLDLRNSPVVSLPAQVNATVHTTQLVLAHMRVSPIPADNVLHVALEGQAPQRLQLLNMMGQRVVDLQGDGNYEYSIDTQHLPAGNYFLQVQLESGLMLQKVLIVH